MKRYNHIFERIINIDNIMKALNRASKGKRGRKEEKISYETISKVTELSLDEIKEIEKGINQE